MMKLSKKTEYAIIALMAMTDADGDKLYTAKEISQKYKIPPEIMGKVLQSLAKNDLIISHQGVKGGYQLTRNLSEININSVITAVEGPLQVVECTSIEECGCDQLSACNIKGPMEMIQNELFSFFGNISLKDLKEKYNPLIQITD